MHHSSDASPQSKLEACLLHTCPCEWFCCDDKATRTRYFVIQGSESFASWQTNLTFDPVQFEDASLGALVHRGIYEAAKGLYRQLLPDILEHLQKHGSLGRIRFTGHSLGGSLAILLFLMLQIRGAVKSNVLLPVMTFGSPSIMCGGDNMLEKLNIPQSLIQSVVMHRDIVPRSFSCHYPDHVAEVLKRINGVFRQHPCLIHQKLLYAPMGDLYILQPEEGVATPHPFLPEGSGMYLMRHPIQNQGIVSHSNSSIEAMELQAALRAFLNSPHPLEILRDPGSYGSNGSISRNHDPRSYAKALDVVLLQELERQMHTRCKRNRQFLWPLFTTLSSGQRVGRLDLIESQATRGAVSSAVGVTHHELRQPVSSATRGGQQHVSMITALGANRSRHVRYKRLIASQHVQMGMLFIVSAKVLLVEGFLALLAWI
ncbi:hypothetical protein O6H91_Y401500 [Diphasiastrum complanatum]|nr:hypothetical protein O6H91_Y401500 [Diphasiastrum complanatum]